MIQNGFDQVMGEKQVSFRVTLNKYYFISFLYVYMFVSYASTVIFILTCCSKIVSGGRVCACGGIDDDYDDNDDNDDNGINYKDNKDNNIRTCLQCKILHGTMGKQMWVKEVVHSVSLLSLEVVLS